MLEENGGKLCSVLYLTGEPEFTGAAGNVGPVTATSFRMDDDEGWLMLLVRDSTKSLNAQGEPLATPP